MMKKYLFILLFPMIVSADPAITTFDQFKTAVRRTVDNESAVLIPDTSLTQDANAALVWTSIDVGGIQAQYRIVTVANQAFYAIPDTISEILTVSFISSDGGTHSVRSWPPEIYEDIIPTGSPTLLSGEDEKAIPIAFNYWADTLQLMPRPVHDDDSVILKCHVEYTVDSSTLQLKAGYIEAAKFYCAYLTSIDLRLFEEATFFLAQYEILRTKL
ncbi:hypothetical protein KAR91_63610, partial [Candidatus Pacearchaeota archaeon]|nr:hypothetical protein [Candidatus Pacearchaeota archaeon]